MSLRHMQECGILSSTTAIVAGIMYRTAGSSLSVDVVGADINLFNIEGGASPNPAQFYGLLIHAAGGIVAATNLGEGHYVVVGRPNWVRLTVGIDAGGPREYGAFINFDTKE